MRWRVSTETCAIHLVRTTTHHHSPFFPPPRFGRGGVTPLCRTTPHLNQPSPDRLALDRPKCRSFFPLPSQISIFLLSLKDLFLELWPRFKAMTHPKCVFGLPEVILQNSSVLRGRRTLCAPTFCAPHPVGPSPSGTPHKLGFWAPTTLWAPSFFHFSHFSFFAHFFGGVSFSFLSFLLFSSFFWGGDFFKFGGANPNPELVSCLGEG